jgi:hypothetical protein
MSGMTQFQRFVAFAGCGLAGLLAAFPPDHGGRRNFLAEGAPIDFGRSALELLAVASLTAAVVLLAGGRPGLTHESPK